MKLSENQLKLLIKESVNEVIGFDSNAEDTLRIEDFFDIDSISKKSVKSITTDMRVFIKSQFGSDMTENGELVIKEGAGAAMPIGQLREELKKFGFKNWQIKTTIFANKVRVVILYAGIAMLSCGWTKTHISAPKAIFGIPLRVIGFDPKEQKTLSKEALDGLL